MPRFKLASLLLLTSYFALVAATTAQFVTTPTENLWPTMPTTGLAIVLPLLLWNGWRIVTTPKTCHPFHLGLVLFGLGGLSAVLFGIPGHFHL